MIDGENIIVVVPWQNQGQGVPVDLPNGSHHPPDPNASQTKKPSETTSLSSRSSTSEIPPQNLPKDPVEISPTIEENIE